MEMATKNAGYTIRKYEMYRTQENGANYVVLAENVKPVCGQPGTAQTAITSTGVTTLIARRKQRGITTPDWQASMTCLGRDKT